MFLPVLLSLIGPPSLYKRRTGWVGFFSAADERGLDDGRWSRSAAEISMQSPHHSEAAYAPPSFQPSPSPNARVNVNAATTTTATVVHQESQFQHYAPFQ